MSAPTSIPALEAFLSRITPFDGLSKEQLVQAARAIEVFFCDRPDSLGLDFDHPHLYVVRTGEFELRGADGRLLDRLATGDQFGGKSLVSPEGTVPRLLVLTPGLIYRLDRSVFERLQSDSAAFELFYMQAHARRLARSVQHAHDDPLQQSVGWLARRAPIVVDSTASIADSATAMRRHRVSSLMVVDSDQLVGIVTDRDLAPACEHCGSRC